MAVRSREPVGRPPDALEVLYEISIDEWARDYGNDAPAPGFRMATGANRELLKSADPRFIIDKPYSRLVADWP